MTMIDAAPYNSLGCSFSPPRTALPAPSLPNRRLCPSHPICCAKCCNASANVASCT